MDFVSLKKIYINSEKWFLKNVINIDVLIELLIISVAIACSFLASTYLTQGFRKLIGSDKRKKLKRFNYLSTKNTFIIIVLIIILFVSSSISQFFKFNSYLQETSVTLLTAWLAISFLSVALEKSSWTQAIAFMIWSLVALSVTGLLDPTLTLLKEASFTVGSRKISAFMVIQGFFIFIILYWFVNFLSKFIEKKLTKTRHFTPAQKILIAKAVKLILITLAVIVGLDFVGLNLTALAFLGGAIAFGVGFGLQKIFSNLISGFILLLDRSIKPGDVISVAGTYGTVQNLDARYVAVVTRDGRKHLIPNETLISEQVENWSFRDNKVRIRIDIGVSYDSDIEKVMEILTSIAQKHPRVLTEPAPFCIIKGFGDYSIDLELRAWIEDPENGLGRPKSEIYLSIWKEFKKEKIEIPFPQSEITLNSSIKKT